MTRKVDSRAGRPVAERDLIDVSGLLDAYTAIRPDPADPSQRVVFGTSGHRGSALAGAFNEAHVVAICAAICRHRRAAGVDGPLFLAADTHALSGPALSTAVEVFVAAGVTVILDSRDGYTPTPAVSHAILRHNAGRTAGLADGVILTPSHNPPQDGGLKYNPPHGGPAEPGITRAIERLANAALPTALRHVARIPHIRAARSPQVARYDYRAAFVAELPQVVDLAAVRAAGVRIGIDPLGGASADYWPMVLETYGLNGAVVSEAVDPRFAFMTADHDGETRMDCSSPYAMARLVDLRDRFDVAFANDPDADRHGVVTPSGGLMEPNRYLTAAVAYLFDHRPAWPAGLAIGKTMVTSALLDRLAVRLRRPLVETPVGFRWFVPGLSEGTLGFAGEESAGAVFRRLDGTLWTTEKDGFSLGLLAAEILARTGRDPSAVFAAVADAVGPSCYERLDAPATAQERARLAGVEPQDLRLDELGGEPVLSVDIASPRGERFGGVRVRTRNAWFAARPSGTEPLNKIYAESFVGPGHLQTIQAEAQKALAALSPGG
ncbi:alpha-D-glucose phosphate-specific phosphoglucomutase [Phenylobacterium sp.]|uniref:alpha-D-glucose phosphate-specific phosphoglucomutase n=1 Tax=Phenylobacterium sp. TaxID=1871053 RepID=UPI003BACB24B